MKKIVCLIVSVLLLTACEKESIKTVLDSGRDRTQNAETRSYEEALSIASSSLSFFPNTRGDVNKIIDESNSFVIKNDKKTRSTASLPDTLFYVFNFTGKNGFAVVSALSTTEGLIAVTEEGDYQSSLKENPAFSFMMELAKEYLTRGNFNPVIEPIDTTLIQSDGPRISVAWGQNYPEGNLFYNGISGCTNTAIAQILTYYMYPSSIVYSENGTNENVSLQWSEIKKHKRTYNNSCYDCTANSSAHTAISKLVRQIGLWNLSNDTTNTNSTSTSTYNQFISINNLGYNYTSYISYTSGASVTQLNNNRLLLMNGSAMSNGNQGHSWVVDGYKQLRVLYLDNNGLEPVYYTETYTYNHINWGWNGKANGYFLDGVFSITNELEYDYNLSFNGSYNFKYNLNYSAIYH